MSYSLGWSKEASKAGEDLNCRCCFCHEPLLKGQDLQSQEIHKCGELHYIELAHAECLCKEQNDCTSCDFDEERQHCSTLS